SHVHDDAMAGLQMWPCGSGEVEDQVDFLSTIAVPLVVGDVFEPVEARHGGVVDENVEMTERLHCEVNKCLTVARHGEVARLERLDRPAGVTDEVDGRVCRFGR